MAPCRLLLALTVTVALAAAQNATTGSEKECESHGGTWADVGDGRCDRVNARSQCNWDGGDCGDTPQECNAAGGYPIYINDGECDRSNQIDECDQDGSDCYESNASVSTCDFASFFFFGPYCYWNWFDLFYIFFFGLWNLSVAVFPVRAVMHPCIIGFDWNWAAALPLLLCPHWWIGILIPLFFSGGGAIVIFFTIVLPFGFNTFRVYRHLKTEQGQMLDLQGKAASEIKTNASFRVPSSRSLVAGDANTIHDVEHAGEDFDDLPPPAYEEVMETESNGAYGGDWRVRATLGRTATFMLKPDTALPNNTNNSSLAAISTNNRIFPFALVTNMGAILAIVVFFTSKTLAGNLLLMLALAFYYGHNLLPLCLGENFQPEEWHFMTKAVMNLDDVKAAVDRDKTKEPSVVFRGVKWHSETRGSGKNRKTVRVETGSDNRTMLIPGVTDVSDDIPEAEFRKYSLIKLTIIRSWEAEEGSEDYFKEQRDRFKQEANTDSEFDYSEFFSLGDLPVHQLLKNNARPSCLLNKYAYGICILFLLAWPWKMYFELCTVQGTIRVRKELTRNGETQSNEV